MYCTHTNDEFIEYAALTIQAHTNDQPNCRRYAVSDRSILLEVETDLTGAHCKWREPGHSANVKAQKKWKSYEGARRRQKEGGKGWLVKGKGTTEDLFVPFAFEVGGALGREAEEFLRECTAVAAWKNQGVGDLAHWSSMTWGGHWRQRIGVEIARGVARCVERAATGGWASSGTGRGCSHEYDPDCG